MHIFLKFKYNSLGNEISLSSYEVQNVAKLGIFISEKNLVVDFGENKTSECLKLE